MNCAIFDTSTKLCRIASIHILISSRYSVNVNFLFSASKQHMKFSAETPPSRGTSSCAFIHLLLQILFQKCRYECFKLGLQLLCFYHLSYTNNLLGIIAWKKIFRSPPSPPSRLSFCASVQVSRDSSPDHSVGRSLTEDNKLQG